MDTIHTYMAMGTQLFILRHPDNNIVQWIASELEETNIAILNAGDASNQQPVQALIDLLTIRQHKKSLETKGCHRG